MTKYEQKVRERAEEFALITNPKSKGYTLERIAKRCEPIARLSIHREADAYRTGWLDSAGLSPDCQTDPKILHEQLQSLGLVP